MLSIATGKQAADGASIVVYVPIVMRSNVSEIPLWRGNQIDGYRIENVDNECKILGAFISEAHAFRKLLEHCLSRISEGILEDRINDASVLQMLEIVKEGKMHPSLENKA